MRLDMLVRLVESFEYYQLRELSLLYLGMLGYKNPRLTDGWNDGGADIRVLRANGEEFCTVVQTSVVKDWKRKFNEDIQKAIDNYSPKVFIYISSRRISELEFTQSSLRYSNRGVSVMKVDGPALASAFYEQGMVGKILEVADIAAVERPPSAPPRSVREDAAYSYLFFSGDARNFRKYIIDQAVLSKLFDSSGDSRASLVASLCNELGMQSNQAAQIRSSIDRLLTKGFIVSLDGSLELSTAKEQEIEASRRSADSEWIALKQRLQEVADKHLPPRSKGNLPGEQLLGVMGPALLAASAAPADMRRDGDNGNMSRLPKLRQRLRHLALTLEEAGVTQAETRQLVIEEMVGIGSNSSVGKSIFAAELFSLVNGPFTDEHGQEPFARAGGHRRRAGHVAGSCRSSGSRGRLGASFR